MRVKGGKASRRRRNKVLKRAKGYYSAGSRSYTIAVERNDRALAYAYRDRKQRKREFRKLWITRISAATKMCGVSYSKFIGALHKSGIELDRKVLSDMAIADFKSFSTLVDSVMKSADSAAPTEA